MGDTEPAAGAVASIRLGGSQHCLTGAAAASRAVGRTYPKGGR